MRKVTAEVVTNSYYGTLYDVRNKLEKIEGRLT